MASLKDDKTECGSQRIHLRPLIPILVENPDGSMSEGVPPGYKEKTPPRSPRGLAEGLWGEVDAMGIEEELQMLHSRHQKLFVSLLLLQFVTEVSFDVIYIFRRKHALQEVEAIYPHADPQHLMAALWTLFVCEVLFGVVYYSLGAVALYTNKPRHYKYFAGCCLIGILGQVLMAYMNKFNLVIFFMRLLTYIYSKFLRSIALHMQLLPAAAAR